MYRDQEADNLACVIAVPSWYTLSHRMSAPVRDQYNKPSFHAVLLIYARVDYFDTSLKAYAPILWVLLRSADSALSQVELWIASDFRYVLYLAPVRVEAIGFADTWQKRRASEASQKRPLASKGPRRRQIVFAVFASLSFENRKQGIFVHLVLQYGIMTSNTPTM